MKRSFLSATPLMAAAQAEGSENGGGEAQFANGPTSASGRIKVAEKDYDEDTGTFSIVFADGAKAEIALNDLPENVQKLLALHGLSQKLGDSYASVKGDVAAAKGKFQAVLEQLMAGEWKKAREAGEGGSKVTELAEAIAQLRGVELAKANAAVAKATKEQLATWRAHPKLKAIIAEIRLRKAQERAAKADEKAKADGGKEVELEIDLS